MDALLDKQAADILNDIPATGITAGGLAEATKLDPNRVQALLDRLLELKLVEPEGETYRPTPFVQKARSVFRFVA